MDAGKVENDNQEYTEGSSQQGNTMLTLTMNALQELPVLCGGRPERWIRVGLFSGG